MKYFIIISFLMLTTILSLSNGNSESIKYNRFQLFPIDELNLDKDLTKVVKDIKKAIQFKNKKLLIKHLDKNIHESFDDFKDIDIFIKKWKLNNNSKKSKIWKILDETIKLGGSFRKINNKTLFVYPYYFYSKLPKYFEDKTIGIITGKNVNIRKSPSLKSKIIDNLSYDVVIIGGRERNSFEETIDGETYTWYKIILYNGKTGYVFGKYLKYFSDYRLFLEKVNNNWKVTLFLAGD